MEKITVSFIQNPFDPQASRVKHELEAGQTVSYYLHQCGVDHRDGMELMVVYDGAEVAPEFYASVIPTGPVAFCYVPKSSNIFRLVAFIGLAIFAPYVGAWAFGSAAGVGWSAGALGLSKVGASLVTAGTFIVGGMLINAVFPAQLPQFDGNNGFETSSTYGWSAASNQLQRGAALPELFGTVRITPPLLNRYIDTVSGEDMQYLNMMFLIAGHKIDSIENIEINGQSIDLFDDDITVYAVLGHNNQPGLGSGEFSFDGASTVTIAAPFSSQRNDVPQNVKFIEAWTERSSVSAVDTLAVILTAPKGLYHVKDNGDLEQHKLAVEMEARLQGGVTWQPWLKTGDKVRINEFTWRVDATRFSMSSNAAGVSVGDQIIPLVGETEDTTVTVTAVSRFTTVHYNDEGEPVGETVQFRVVITGTLPAGMTGAFLLITDAEISGREAKTKRFVYHITPHVAGVVEYRFRLTSAPIGTTRYAEDLYLEYQQEIINEEFTYPNSALLGLRIRATDRISGGAPTVTMEATRSTVPVWTGAAYVQKPANNPAWINYHQLHDDLSGGGVPHARIVYADFDEFATWCAAQGFLSNIYIDNVMSLKAAMDTVSMIGRAQVVQRGSKFSVMVDKPDTSTQRFMFGMGNILYDSFQQEWLPMVDRADAIEVTYWDADDRHQRKTVTVYQDGFDESALVSNPASVPLYGCTSRAVAVRHGKFLLNKGRYLTLTATWSADIDAIGCIPGDVVDVSHDLPAWGYSGRVVAAAATTVTLDQSVTLSPGTTYVVEVKKSNDTREAKTFTVGVIVTTDQLTVTAWATVPAKYDLYQFGVVNLHNKKFRVLDISSKGDLQKTITGLEYVAEVYDDALVIPEPDAPAIGQITGLTAAQSWFLQPDGTGVTVVNLYWRAGETEFQIYYRVAGARDWTFHGVTRNTQTELYLPFPVGVTIQFLVRRLDGRHEAQTDIIIAGKTWLPSNVETVTLTVLTTGIRIEWTPVPDLDVKEYIVYLGATFAEAVEIFRGHQAQYLWEVVAAAQYVFWVVALDTIGQTSGTPATAQVTIENPNIPQVTHKVEGENIILEWLSVQGYFPITEYIIRLGDIYATSVEVHRTKSTFFSFKGTWLGNRRYWVEAVDAAGNESTPMSRDVTIQPPSIVLDLASQVIHNHLILRWSAPAVHTLPIAFYRFRVGEVFATAERLGDLQATFALQQELEKGLYRYWIQAVDTADNPGPETSILAEISAPPDYVLLSDKFLLLDQGTLTSDITVGTDENSLLGPANDSFYETLLTEDDFVITDEAAESLLWPTGLYTWEGHFITNTWTSPDDQITAGFPFYLQPTPASAIWEREIDYGVVIPPAHFSLTIDSEILDGTPTVAADLEFSLDDITYTVFLNTIDLIAPEFRYARIRIKITGTDPEDLMRIRQIRAMINLPIKKDSGKFTALSTDADGTWVAFNVAFLDITSIIPTIYAESADPALIPLVIFADIPNPLGFYFKIFDSAGTRYTRSVGWEAQGL